MSVAPIQVGETDKTLQGVAYVVSGGLITGVKTDLVVADIDSLYVIRDQSTAVTISSDGSGLTNKTNQNDAHSDGAVWNPGDGTLFVDIPDAAVALYAKDVQLKGTWTDGSDSGVIRGTPVALVNHAWAQGPGTGARTITVHVTNASGGADLAGCSVTIKDSASLVKGRVDATDANGEGEVYVNDGLYTVIVSRDGFITKSQAVTVSGDATVEVELTASEPTASDAGLVTGYLYTRVNGEITAGKTVTLTITKRPISGDYQTGIGEKRNEPATSDANGYVEFLNLLPGAEYEAEYEGTSVRTAIPTDAVGSVKLNTVAADAS